MKGHHPSFIERLAETLHLIPNHHGADGDELPPIQEPGNLTDYPPPEKWDDWVSMHATSGQRRETKNNMIVPTTCLSWLSAAIGAGDGYCVGKVEEERVAGHLGLEEF